MSSTPLEVSAPILDLCRELVGDGEPVFIEITARADAAALDCFSVIERQVAAKGGAVVYGWRIWEWTGVMIEAEFHAVWKDEEGVLRDLTPTPSGAEQGLFVADSARVYEGCQINNVRRALTVGPEIPPGIWALACGWLTEPQT